MLSTYWASKNTVDMLVCILVKYTDNIIMIQWLFIIIIIIHFFSMSTLLFVGYLTKKALL